MSQPDKESEWIRHVEQVSLFTQLKSETGALEALTSQMHSKSFAPGTSILVEGANGSEMYLLIEGQASVYKSTPEGDSYKVAILSGKQFAFFGEGGLLGDEARSATIKADTACKCLVLERPAFESFTSQHPRWALPIVRNIANAMMSRLKKANNDLMLLYKALVAEVRGH